MIPSRWRSMCRYTPTPSNNYHMTNMYMKHFVPAQAQVLVQRILCLLKYKRKEYWYLKLSTIFSNNKTCKTVIKQVCMKELPLFGKSAIFLDEVSELYAALERTSLQVCFSFIRYCILKLFCDKLKTCFAAPPTVPVGVS